MKFTRQHIKDIILCEPNVYQDSRGSFCESFRSDKFNNFLGREINFIQENESISKKDVFRGLHFQRLPEPQSKLVRVVSGSIIDFAVDLRKESKTYCHHVKIRLSESNKKQLFIPSGFAHGFLSLENNTKVVYKVDNYFNSDLDAGVNFKDEIFNLSINIFDLKVSDKDLSLPFLDELKNM